MPGDSLIKWEEAPRPSRTLGLAFYHPLRGTIWEDWAAEYIETDSKCIKPNLKMKMEGVEGLEDKLVLGPLIYAQDVRAEHIMSLLDVRGECLNLILREPKPRREHTGEKREFLADLALFASSGKKSLEELSIYAKDAVCELINLPFRDQTMIAQLQEGVQEVGACSELRSYEFLTHVARSLDAITMADHREPFGHKDVLGGEREIFESLDLLLEYFPKVKSKLWVDIRDMLLSSHVVGSPIELYRRILNSDNLSVRVKTQTFEYDVAPSNVPPSKESSEKDFTVYKVVKDSYQRQKAVSLLSDALRLAVTTVFIANAVHQYKLSRVEFSDKLSLDKVGHPFFYVQESPQLCMNDFRIQSPDQFVCITGPTEGGKTTAVRTIGAAVLMGHALGYVCAENPRMPLFKRMLSSFIHTDDLEKGLSSFRSEVETFMRHYQLMDDKTWYVGDEILRTSEPTVGPIVLPRLVKAILAKGVRGTMATHYHDAVHQLHGKGGVRGMFISSETYYELQDGVSPGGYALASAIRAGLPPEIAGNGNVSEPLKPSSPIAPSEHFFVQQTLSRTPLNELLNSVKVPTTIADINTQMANQKHRILRDLEDL